MATTASDLWPRGIRPDLENVKVAIARTEPRHGGREAVREVEALHLDAIAAARASIFIENQYLTTRSIGDVLERRLAEPNGPEVVVIGPRKCVGWLEETTMGVMRARMIDRLRAADHGNRLRIYYPVVPELGERRLHVHSKVMVVDDRFARVGSANLNNRSMGFDSECDLAIEAENDAQRPGVTALRDRLLAEHLGASVEEVCATQARTGSLIETIEQLRGGPRTLEPLSPEVAAWLQRWMPSDGSLADPDTTWDECERTAAPAVLAQMLAPLDSAQRRRWFWLGVAGVVGGVSLLVRHAQRRVPT